MSGWEVESCGGLKGGEEGELISELKSNIRKKKNFFSMQAMAGGGLVNYSSQGKCSSFPVFVKKALLAHSYGHSLTYLWLLLSHSGQVLHHSNAFKP